MQKTHQANYDAANKLSSLYNCLANGAPLAYFDYQYDAASRITGCRREDGTQIYYQYDPASRLTRETWYESAAMQPIYSFAWDYDLAGNRIYQNYNDRQTYYFYNPGNTLIRKQEQGEAPVYYHYDNRGNCTIIQESDGSSYFSYNYANLVTDIRFKSGVSNYFFYDSRLRRYALQDSDGLRYFTWDAGGLNLLYEKDASGNVVAEYTHGYTPVAGIGSLVAAKKNVGGASYYQYPAYDHRGSVVRISDESGVVTAYYAYNAWGMPLVKQESGVGNRFTWQSNWIELKDSGGELLLAPFRLYSVDDGRFLSHDPLGYVDGLNLYEAFGGNPESRLDILGMIFGYLFGLSIEWHIDPNPNIKQGQTKIPDYPLSKIDPTGIRKQTYTLYPDYGALAIPVLTGQFKCCEVCIHWLGVKFWKLCSAKKAKFKMYYHTDVYTHEFPHNAYKYKGKYSLGAYFWILRKEYEHHEDYVEWIKTQAKKRIKKLVTKFRIARFRTAIDCKNAIQRYALENVYKPFQRYINITLEKRHKEEAHSYKGQWEDR